MVERLFVEKREGASTGFSPQDAQFLGLSGLTGTRRFLRYDIEGLSPDALSACIDTVFSEPPLDIVTRSLPPMEASFLLTVAPLPGQYDQRADSAAQCVQLVTMGDRPTVRTATIYAFFGALTDSDCKKLSDYLVNPVEACTVGDALPTTLALSVEMPPAVPVLEGFVKAVRADLRHAYGLAMDENDVAMVQNYFQKEGRDPTLTELKLLDTYWSDHCRHTTFLTELTDIQTDDVAVKEALDAYFALRDELGTKRPISLMDLATIQGRALFRRGALPDLDVSDEINACTFRVTILVDGKPEPWLVLFKNETHNHPTEIEPFGGAATCIGGAIRDPLSGRAYVYQAMRVTGAANPLAPLSETLPGKLPQRKLTTTAASGFSSYGNQIGLATGLVDELYHPGYAAKRMEIGAVIGAAPAGHIRREEPAPGDIVVLLGGRTGRDGCGGATGSSKSHTATSLETCAAEVQKGNAPEEHKLQRLFRNPEAAGLIKRCNDFGAGGVAVAIGELADGLIVNLDNVPKKYEGLSGTELAISESQERMAVVLEPKDVARFLELAAIENLEATQVAVVTLEKRLVMRWKGQTIVNIGRDFLSSNGASRTATAHIAQQTPYAPPRPRTFAEGLRQRVTSLNGAAKIGLSERFDATIGAGSVLLPFGGARQLTPADAMAAFLPVQHGQTDAVSVMTYGFSPERMEHSPFWGAYAAVVESAAKLVAAGGDYTKAHFTFQEYFERMGTTNWGVPLSALLGALKAQQALGRASIGGKDSMSGSFEDLHVPPTLVSFAVVIADAKHITHNVFTKPGRRLALLSPANDSPEALRACLDQAMGAKATAAQAVGIGGIAEAVFRMGLGNRIGFAFDENFDPMTAFDAEIGTVLLETDAPIGVTVGHTQTVYEIHAGAEIVDSEALEQAWLSVLEPVFRRLVTPSEPAPRFTTPGATRVTTSPLSKPRVLIPAFPGTNCEEDSARAFRRAGADAQVFILQNRTADDVTQSAYAFIDALKQSQILFLPGGFSGGDEPDGSGKFICAFLRSPRIAEEVMQLLNGRKGLVGGVCNGFQALIKLGLIPFGDIRAQSPDAPTLTYNQIGRHQSRLVSTRVCSNRSPWLSRCAVDTIEHAPISHGEGRILMTLEQALALEQNGQIATQYVDAMGEPTMDIRYNPAQSSFAIEGLTSPDGRVFGRMAHSERTGAMLYQNVPATFSTEMFLGAVNYFA